jgi:hypothetical protein
MLPFTHDQFFGILRDYNAALWPASILFHVLATLALVAIVMGWAWAPKIAGAALAAMWAWTGLAYHLAFFTRINGAAYGFAALFVMGAALFLWRGAIRQDIRPAPWLGWRSGLGWALIAYALVIYPLIGLSLGRPYADLPQFGVTPCPVTLFTFGILLLMPKPVKWDLLIAPAVWSLIGGSAAFLLGVPQDWVLLASGIATVAALKLSAT